MRWLFVVGLSVCVLGFAQTGKERYVTGGQAQFEGPRPATAGQLKAIASAGPRPAAVSIGLLGSAPTPSPAQSAALYGNIAYVCDNNEVTVVNISNPSSPQVLGTLSNGLIQNSGNIHCSVQRNTLSIFSDQSSSTIGNTPAFLAFSLTNPASPQLIAATPLNKRFFTPPVYIGNYAFVATWAISFFGPNWESQYGDLLSVNLTNFSTPSVIDTLEEPLIDPQLGGSTIVLGATQADQSLLYLGGSTSTLGPGARFGWGNLGTGRLQVVDVANPTSMKLTSQLLVPGTKHSSNPLIQGTVGVALGNNGGFSGSGGPNFFAGNIVVTTFDVSDRRQPSILSITTTSFKPGPGGGATRIGNMLFAFSGVTTSSGAPVLLTVDVTNPRVPVIDSIPLAQPFTSLQAIGTTLYATQGSGGFAMYSIPGIDNTPVSACPALVDTMLVLDRGAALPPQAFNDAKTALKEFIDSLHLPADQVGVGSFTTSGSVNQALTTNSAVAKTAFDTIVAGGTSYIGSGIAAAQAELTGARHNAGAFQVMVVLSDGADLGAPNSNATLAAANTAKAAGIRIISLQYGSTPSPLMQSIASTAADFHLLGQ